MSFKHFKMLMWKNYRIKRHHKWVTIVELILPIGATLLYLYIRDSPQKYDKQAFQPNTQLAYSLDSFDINLCYAPSTSATTKFMEKMKQEAKIIEPLPDGVELEHHIFQIGRENLIGIHFLNFESSDSLPDKFSYILRQSISVDVPDNKYFAKAQLLLNKNFIRYKLEQTENIKINVTDYEKIFTELTIQPFSSMGYAKTENFSEIVLIILFLLFVIVITSVPFITDILEEKNGGIKELMRITGVKEWMIWLSWFLHGFSITPAAITVVLIMVFGASFFSYTPFMALWMFMILFYAANISFCFMITSIFQNNKIAAIIFLLQSLVAISEAYFKEIEKYVSFIKYLYPIGNYGEGAKIILDIESNDVPFTWTTSSLFFVLCMLLFNTLLYMLLAYYIASINPGNFGIQKSPLFLFKRFFSKNENQEIPLTGNQENNIDPRFYEAPPSNLKTAIRIVDLHKYFKSVHAVRGVNLNIYEGEITVLLGHNGAGKTVTISMLTGLTTSSSGSVLYKNKNVFKNMDEFRSHIGFCPQKNITFPYFSVMNHLLFFGQLKGLSLLEATEQANEYLQMLNMEKWKDHKVKEISGGLKRILCLSMGMMGKSEILILDEPTSGLNAELRRSLWNLFLKLRGKKSLILTTHHMMEADTLGDRIVIMSRGIIVCYGTPIFLKKAYDAGYKLKISKGSDNSGAITKLVQTVLPSASVVSDARQEIVYKLLLTDSHRFPALFQSLESAMSRLNIENIGVTATTMEQVFLKTGGSVIYDLKSPKIIRHDAHYGKMTGLALHRQQILAILKKKFLFTNGDRTNIFVRVFLSTVVLYPFLKNLPLPEQERLPIDISLSHYVGDKVVYQEVNPFFSFQKDIEEFVAEKKGVLLKKNDGFNVVEGHFHEEYESKIVSGIRVNGSSIKLMHSDTLDFSLSITIDTYANVLLRTLTNTKRYSVKTISHSVPYKQPKDEMTDPAQGHGCFNFKDAVTLWLCWFLLLGVLTTDILGYFSQFISMERGKGFYHAQKMSRIPLLVYLLGTLLFDFILFAVIMTIRIIFFKLFGNNTPFIGFIREFYILLLILTLYGIAGLLMIYTMTFLIIAENPSHTFFYHLIANMISAVVMGIYQQISIGSQLNLVEFEWKTIAFLNVTWILTFIIPTFTFYLVIFDWLKVFYINTQCLRCFDMYEYKPICEDSTMGSVDSLLKPIIVFALQIPAYLMILLLIDSGCIGRLCNFAVKQILYRSKLTSTDEGDEDVKQEYNRVQEFKNILETDRAQNISLLVDRLSKNYFRPRIFTAVSDLNFMVERGMCFGLLGVNGAGKTTTFKMLTTEIIPTFGDAYINGIRLSENRQKYLSGAGYCPQTNAIIDQLTGEEMLTIVASMKGISSEVIKELVNEWISVVGLDEYKHRRCGTYSCGNQRKLCSAMALIGDPKVVFLDEPTTGIDPVSRHNLYEVMRQSKADGQSVIIASHDMDECETLCDRLSIMASGVMKCIGTVQHLKKRYAQGFSALFKIIDSRKAEEKLPELKQSIEKALASSEIVIKKQHKGVLYYHIEDTSLLWSVLFEKMESIKSSYPDVVQDYVLTDAHLDHVFIFFAKN